MLLLLLLTYFAFGEVTTPLEVPPAIQTCSVSSEMINQLKAYMICQSSPMLASCAGLATAFNERPQIRKALDLSLPAMDAKNIDQLSDQLGEELYQSDSSADPKVSYKQLSPAVKALYYQQARQIVVKVLQKSSLGQVDDYILTGIVRQSFKLSKKFAGRVLTQKINSAPAVELLKTAIANESKMYSARIPSLLGKGAISAAESFAVTKAAGSANPLIAARILSASLLMLGVAGDVVMSTTSLGCDVFDANFMNLDENCKPVYEIDGRTQAFLLLDEKAQRASLQHTQSHACAYYQELYDHLFTKTHFKNLECTTQGFTLQVSDQNNHTQNVKAMYRYTTHDIKQISLGKPNPLQMNDDGSVRFIDSPDVAADAVPLKLYIMDAYDCCNAVNATTRQNCLAAYQ